MKMARVTVIFLTLMVLSVHQGSSMFINITELIEYSNKLNKMDTTKDNTKRITDFLDVLEYQKPLFTKLKLRSQEIVKNLQDRWKNKKNIEILGLDEKFLDDFKKFDESYNLLPKIAEGNAQNLDLSYATCIGPVPFDLKSYLTKFTESLLKVAEIEGGNRCDTGVSAQQELYQFYEYIVAIEVKIFTIKTMSCSILKSGNPICKKAAEGAHINLVQHIQSYMTIIKNGLQKLSLDIRRCEPSKYIRDANYFELERYIRKAVNNLDVFTPFRNRCIPSCERINEDRIPELANPTSIEEFGLRLQECYDCESVEKYEYCLPDDADHDPRALYGALFNKTEQFGPVCDGNKRIWTSTFDKTKGACQNCLCTCVNHFGPHWQYSFSMKPQTSDINQNMVITGIKFKKEKLSGDRGHIIYPQIKVGKLLPRGEVKDAEWKNYDINHVNATLETIVTIGNKPNQVQFVNLDDVSVPAGYVITGVKFQLYESGRPTKEITTNSNKHTAIAIIVRQTRFDFTNGQLDKSKDDNWVKLMVDKKADNSMELSFKKMDVPIKAKTIKPNSVKGQRIRFSMTDMKKDFGQTTVPYFDNQPVETVPPSPLSGIGLFHKGEKGFGGFLALRIMTPDMMHLIDSDISQDDKKALGL